MYGFFWIFHLEFFLSTNFMQLIKYYEFFEFHVTSPLFCFITSRDNMTNII